MKTGRPTKLTPELLKTARDYIINHMQYGDVIPTVAGLSIQLNITRTTAYEWAKEEGSEFSDILSDLMAHQENKLVSNGLGGAFNSTITKLILTKHGYSDKSEVENKGQVALVIGKDDATIV